MKAKYTPGPWEVIVRFDGGYYITNEAQGRNPAEACTARQLERPTNVALIAAAPDLLAALVPLAHLYRGQITNTGEYYPALLDAAINAIAKAEGRSS